MKISETKLSMPVFGAKRLGTYFVLSGGGGGKKFGLPNTLQTMQMANLETVGELDTEDQIFSGVLPIPGTRAFFSWSEKNVGVFEVGPKGKLSVRKEVTLVDLFEARKQGKIQGNEKDKESPGEKQNNAKKEDEEVNTKSDADRKKKLALEENLEWVLCAIYKSKRPPSKEITTNLRKELKERRKLRVFLGSTENGILMMLSNSLNLIFELDLKEPVLTLSWAPNLRLAVIYLKSGGILFFNVKQQRFVHKISPSDRKDNVSGYSDQFNQIKSKVKKAIILPYPRILARTISESDSEPDLSRGILIFLTFMNKQTFSVLLKNPLCADGGTSWVDLGQMRVSWAKFIGSLGLLVASTGTGNLTIFETGPGVGNVLRPIKNIIAHKMPVPVMIIENLHSCHSEDLINNLLCSYDSEEAQKPKKEEDLDAPKGVLRESSQISDFLDGLIEKLNFTNERPKIGIWSFGLDYDCKMWGGDVRSMRKKSIFGLWFLGVVFFLLSVLYFFFLL